MTDPALFPADFLWGGATSAYQVEGSPLADGAGPSIWERFAHTPGMMRNGDTGDVACDHYRRYRDDVAMMKALGLKAYRFSIAWARVLPEGTGRVNEGGLGFYDRLVDALLEAGIQPLPTLYHWDLPAALDDRGGWLNRDVADWFADYGRVMFKRLGDRVKMWGTINEPWVITDGGYLFGALAPGHRNRYEAPIASHNILRAHGMAVRAYRAERRDRIGLVVNIEPKYPHSKRKADLDATRRADAYMNRQYLDPAYHGRYPAEMREIFREAWPEFPAADFDVIREKTDFLGVNYYTRSVVRHDPDNWLLQASRVKQKGALYTETDWEVFPQAFYDMLVWVKERYGNPPVYVTENGAAFADPPKPTGGRLADPKRVAYYRSHLKALRDARAAGCDIRGYFAWSVMDNLEWSLGFSKRFGIVHVDFKTQKRTPKDSARFYSQVIATNGAALDEAPAAPRRAKPAKKAKRGASARRP